MTLQKIRQDYIWFQNTPHLLGISFLIGKTVCAALKKLLVFGLLKTKDCELPFPRSLLVQDIHKRCSLLPLPRRFHHRKPMHLPCLRCSDDYQMRSFVVSDAGNGPM